MSTEAKIIVFSPFLPRLANQSATFEFAAESAMIIFPLWAWVAFLVFTAFMLALDLGVFRRGAKEVSMGSALMWCGIWFALALAFNGFVASQSDSATAMLWFTSYLVEICLSVDNLFVFILVFNYFKVGGQEQHRVLFWGILGAAIMRAVFIFAGIGLLHQFKWVIYIFGAFLVVTGIKLALPKKEEESLAPESNATVRFARRFMPVSTSAQPGRFFVRENGALAMTPLFLVLLVIESTDLAFALDSIPAVIAITPNPFIAFTSNIFAILGLRSLYFALKGVMGLFRFLNYGLAIVLTFIGAKMLVAEILPIRTGISLAVIGLVLGATIALSLLLPEKPENRE